MVTVTQQPRTEDGKYSTWEHAELDMASAGIGSEQAKTRFEMLAACGFVPAASATGRNTGVADWWEKAYSTAEIGAEDGTTYVKMTDSSGSGTGNALDGTKRLQRRTYRGGALSVRMPSASAIRRFAADHDGETFDIPVSMTEDGSEQTAWVRVTRTGSRWAASPVGLKGEAGAKMAEAVSATLEARQVTVGMAQAGDLLARRRARQPRYGAETVDLSGQGSGWVTGASYHDGQLTVVMGDRAYGYQVDHSVYERLINSTSPGTTYNALIKSRSTDEVPRVGVNRCSGCGRFSSATTAHVCPGRHNAPTSTEDRAIREAASRALARRAGIPIVAPPVADTPVAPEPVPEPDRAGVRSRLEQRRARRAAREQDAAAHHGLVDQAGASAAHWGRKFGAAEDLDSQVLEQLVRASGRGTVDLTNTTGGYVHTAAKMAAIASMNGDSRNASSAHRAAMVSYLDWKDSFRTTEGREPTRTEQDEAADEIRLAQPSRRRASAGFHMPQIKPLDVDATDGEGRRIYAEIAEPEQMPRMNDAILDAADRPSSLASTQAAWSAIAPSAPQIADRSSGSRKVAPRPTGLLRHVDERGVVGLIAAWRDETITAEEAKALFRPWDNGAPLTFEQERQIVAGLTSAATSDPSAVWTMAEVSSRRSRTL